MTTTRKTSACALCHDTRGDDTWSIRVNGEWHTFWVCRDCLRAAAARALEMALGSHTLGPDSAGKTVRP